MRKFGVRPRLEGERDDLGLDARLAHDDAGSGLGLAADPPQRDGTQGGGEDGGPDSPDLTLAEADRVARRDRRFEAKSAEVAVRLPSVMEPGDSLLADVAPLSEADGALVDPSLLRDRRGGHLAAEARPSRLHAQDLRGGLGHLGRA